MRVMQYTGATVRGGLTGHVSILTKGLVGAGVDVHLVVPPAKSIDRFAADCEHAGARVSRLAVKGKTDLAGMVRLQRLVAADEPDLLHVHLSSPVEAFPALMAARWGGARCVVTTEHAPTWSPLERPYSRAAKRTTSRSLRAVIALSESDAAYLKGKFGVPERILAVIPNGVPIPERLPSRREARSRLGLPEGAILAGFAGALEEKKGIRDLLEAARLCALPDLALAFAGEGSLELELRRSDPGSAPRFVLGRLEEMGTFLAALDLFVLPSHQEAMPLALLEALAAGLPVVATRVGGIPEAIRDGVTGLLASPANPGEIADRMVRLARDPELSRRLGAAARGDALQRFGAERMVARVAALYARVLERGAR